LSVWLFLPEPAASMDNIKKIILIVDDSALVIERLVSMLEGLINNLAVVTCLNFKQAIVEIDKKDIDIALLDINLSDGNGIGLLRYIKKNKPSVTVIMLTNQSTEFYRKMCLAEGADYFIDKSSGYDLLPEIILSALK
jgi:DNA-binding NarL/FixJ family response regulator